MEKCIGVDDGGQSRFGEQTAYEGTLFVTTSEAGPDRQRGSPLSQLVHTLARRLHRLDQERLDDRQRLLRNGDRDIPGVRAKRGFGSETERAGHPGGSADDEHRPRRVLRVALMAARDKLEDLVGDKTVPRVGVLEP